MMHRLLFLAALMLFAAIPVEAEEGATLLRATELRSEPYSDASVITTLKAHTTLTILQRKGGWYQARTGSQQIGWVRMSTIRLGELKTGGSGIGDTLRFLNSGRSGSSGVTVATGIRGLDSADVANAKPDHHAVKHLEHFHVSADQARAYASQGKLKSRKLGYMK